MDIELVTILKGKKLHSWEQLLRKTGLAPEEQPEQTVLLWDGESLAATGSRQGNLLKYLAIDPVYQGEGLLSTLLTTLRQQAFSQGHSHLFLYTKPENEQLFLPLFFYPVVCTEQVLLMEDRKDGIHTFLDTLPADNTVGTVGAAVMNCDPFTLGHRYLIETAAAECDRLYVFVLSEDKSRFSAADRLNMVKYGTAHLSNVTVLPTGPYLISSATFPTYFLKDRDCAKQVHCQLDMAIFTRYYAPKFHITCRYVGTEPLSPMTEQYNRIMEKTLPAHGIALKQFSRLELNGKPISASAVRAALDAGNLEAVRKLVPETTFDYLKTIL